MPAEKKILLLLPSGAIIDLGPQVLSYQQLKSTIGGYIEHVTVLDRIERSPRGDRWIYTSMYVHEEGRLIGLPHNPKATAIYQRNIRAQRPGHPYPFAEVEQEMQAAATKAGVFYINLSESDPTSDPDYPDIVGPAIYYQGWDIQEIEREYERLYERNEGH